MCCVSTTERESTAVLKNLPELNKKQHTIAECRVRTKIRHNSYADLPLLVIKKNKKVGDCFIFV